MHKPILRLFKLFPPPPPPMLSLLLVRLGWHQLKIGPERDQTNCARLQFGRPAIKFIERTLLVRCLSGRPRARQLRARATAAWLV